MAAKDIEKAFLEAAEIAKKLPKNLQETGFNKAVEQLLGKWSQAADKRRSPGAERRKESEAANDRDVSTLVEAIDRTAYPDVGATTRVGDRALKVLQLAREDHGVDGLTAGEISTILSRQFRLRTKTNSVLKALDRETGTVDVRSGAGASRVFQIMAPGEAYLATLRAGEDVRRGRQGGTARAGARRRKAPANEVAAKQNTPKKKAAAAKKAIGKKAAGRPGPKAAIGQLLSAGFFRSAKTISEIQAELQHRRGHGYSVQELSPALVRSIRDESLSRERNSEGQYEYSQA